MLKPWCKARLESWWKDLLEKIDSHCAEPDDDFHAEIIQYAADLPEVLKEIIGTPNRTDIP